MTETGTWFHARLTARERLQQIHPALETNLTAIGQSGLRDTQRCCQTSLPWSACGIAWGTPVIYPGQKRRRIAFGANRIIHE